VLYDLHCVENAIKLGNVIMVLLDIRAVLLQISSPHVRIHSSRKLRAVFLTYVNFLYSLQIDAVYVCFQNALHYFSFNIHLHWCFVD